MRNAFTGNRPSARRTFLTGALALGSAVALGPAGAAEIANLNQAIDKAGRQRMLSQRMAKAWLAIGQDLMPARAERILEGSIGLFERQLAELSTYAPTPNISSTYQALAQVWSPYKAALINGPPSAAKAVALVSADAQVLKLAHQGTQQLEEFAGKPLGKLVNMSGRQRMLSQRMAKFYLLKAWSVPMPEAVPEMNHARTEFVRALGTLTSAPEATDLIRDELELARQQWVFFDNALVRVNESSNTRQRAAEVFASSENILQVMETVTGLYSSLKPS